MKRRQKQSRFPRLKFSIPDAYTLVGRIHPGTRRTVMISLGAALTILTVHLHVFAPKGLIARQRITALIEARKAATTEAAAENERLRTQITSLSSDNEALEALARNEFSMARPNETIYKLKSDTIPQYVLAYTPTSTVR